MRHALLRVVLFWVAYFDILLLASVAKSAQCYESTAILDRARERGGVVYTRV